jgi:hypothetical protein
MPWTQLSAFVYVVVLKTLPQETAFIYRTHFVGLVTGYDVIPYQMVLVAPALLETQYNFRSYKMEL